MLIEVHILQNHAPSNLNRDDTGSPKDAIFGGYKRSRISSQCLKRSIRRSENFKEYLEDQLAVRTRSLPEMIRQNLLKEGVSQELAEIAARKISGFGTSDGKEQKPNGAGQYRTAQTMFMTNNDIVEISKIVSDLIKKDSVAFKSKEAKDIQKDASDMGCRPITVDMALFGRMTTSEAFIDVEASSQFAHAISTHKIDHEFDFFTAVDDRERSADDEAGSGADMLGDIEFNSACYYKYFNIHVDEFIKNLTGEAFKQTVTDGDKEYARKTASIAIKAMIEAACRVTPTGKQNSFAAHQMPSTVWVEIRDKNLPVSYANAFAEPVKPRTKEGLEFNSANFLKTECEKLAVMFNLEARKRLLLSKFENFSILDIAPSQSLKDLLSEVEVEILRG